MPYGLNTIPKGERSMMRPIATYILLLAAWAATAGCPPQGKPIAGRPADPPKPPPQAPRYEPSPINPLLREQARRQVAEAFDSSDESLQMNAVEALKYMGEEGAAAIVTALDDPRGPVRYSAALAAGELKQPDARPALLKIADEPNRHHRIAAIYALHRLGDTRQSHDLEKFALSTDAGIRRNTAMVLGMTGDSSALNVLRDMQKDRDDTVRLEVAIARWRLGDSRAVEEVIVGMASGFPDIQMVSLLGAAQRGDTRVAQHIYARLTDHYPEVALVAARALGILGYDDGLQVALNGTTSGDARQRHLAAFALGAIGRNDRRCQDALAKLLDDPKPEVRIAAATAIYMLKPPGQESGNWISRRGK